MSRILFITERYRPSIGGVATSATRISQALAADGAHQVDVFVAVRDLPAGAAQRESVSRDLTIHRFGRSKNADFTMQQSMSFLEWLHRRERFDLVWGHYVAHAGFLAAWFAKSNELPAVLSVRGNDLDRQLFPPGDLARLQWCLQNCRQVVAVSRDLAAKVRTLVGRESFVLPNVVDTQLFEPGDKPPGLVERYELRPDELVLAFSGELRAKKGLPFLVQAFRDVLARRPAWLLIVGDVRPGNLGEFERALAGHPDAARRVIRTGQLDDPRDVRQHLLLADVFLLPSLWDGMPNSLLEAMATGIPVIASDAGAIPEVVTDGVTGILVPRTHLHRLAERVDEFLAQPGRQRQEMTDAARRHVCENYSLAIEAELLTELLQRPASSAS